MLTGFFDSIYKKYLYKEIDTKRVFCIILEKIIEITKSKYGFIGIVKYDEKGNPFLKTYHITDISWNEETKRLYDANAEKGFEFRNLNTLFGWVMLNKEPLITNDAPNDPRAGGIPKGHPALNKFIGIPFMFNGEIIGMAALANGDDDYSSNLLDELQPFIQTCALILSSIIREQVLNDLIEKNKKNESLLKKIVQYKSDVILELDTKTLKFTDAFIVNSDTLLAKPESFLGKTVYDVFPEDLANKFYLEIQQCINERERYFEYNITLPEIGGKRYYKAYSYIESKEDSIKFSITDITSEKNYENILLQQQNLKTGSFIGSLTIDCEKEIITYYDNSLLSYFNHMPPVINNETIINYFKYLKYKDIEKIKSYCKTKVKEQKFEDSFSFILTNNDDSIVSLNIIFSKTDDNYIKIDFYDFTSQYLLDINNKKLSLKYEKLLDNLEDFVIITDNKFNIIELNQSFSSKTNLLKNNILGKNLHNYIIAEDQINNAIYGLTDRIVEGLITLNNEKIYCLIKKTKFEIGNNDFLYQYVITDLSDYQNTKEALSNSTHTLTTVIDNLHYGILYESENRIIKHVNSTFLNYYGLDKNPSELTNTLCYDLLKDVINCFKYPEQTVAAITKILNEKVLVLNDEVEFKNGKFFNRSYIPIIDGEKYLGHLWIYNDITKTKEQEKKIIENEQRLQLAISASNDGFWDWDLTKDTIFFSPRWKSMLGYSDHEIENNLSAWEKLIFPADKNTALSLLEKFIKGEVDEFKIQQRFYHKNGSIIHVLSKAVLTKDENHKTVRIVGAHTDITTSINNEINLLQQKEKAERSEKIMQQFLSNISHEMRTPLNSIIGFVNLLKNTPVSAKQAEYLNDLKFSSVGLLKLINDILDLSKIQSGTLVIEEEAFNLKEHLKHILAQVKNKSDEKNLKLITQFDFDYTKYIITDKVRLSQILVNILINAIKFTERGYVSFTAKILNQKEGTINVCFNIEDSGIGISREKQLLIFDDFYQASDKKNYSDGVGLGLSIVKKIITILNGTITLKSTIGLGSNFEIILPLKLVSEESINNEINTHSHSTNIFLENEYFKDIKVLIVEDNPMSLKVFKEFLNNYEINNDFAVNGEEAVNLVVENDYNAIFMDYQMPVLDGIEATKIIRTLPDTKKSNVPIIALSAAVFKDDKEKFFECGMNYVIEKPYSEEKVLSILKEIIDDRLKKEIYIPKQKINNNELNYFNLSYYKERKMSKPVILELLELYEKSILKVQNEFINLNEINHFENIRLVNHDLANNFLALGIRSLYEETLKMSSMLSGKITCDKNEKLKQWKLILNLSNESLKEIPLLINLL